MNLESTKKYKSNVGVMIAESKYLIKRQVLHTIKCDDVVLDLVKLTDRVVLHKSVYMNLCMYLHNPIKKIKLMNLPNDSVYNLVGHGLQITSTLENKYQVFDLTNNKGSLLFNMKSCANSEINKKMSNKQNMSSLNFYCLDSMVLKLHSGCTLFNSKGNFITNELIIEVDGFRKEKNKIVDYTQTIKINPNNVYRLKHVNHPVEELKILNCTKATCITNNILTTDNGTFTFNVDPKLMSDCQKTICELYKIPLYEKTLDFSRVDCKYIQFNTDIVNPEIEWTYYNIEMYSNNVRMYKFYA